MDIATAWKKSHLILSDRLDFHMFNNLLIASHTFARHMLTSLSIDEILLPWHVNCSTNFRGFPSLKKTKEFSLKCYTNAKTFLSSKHYVLENNKIQIPLGDKNTLTLICIYIEAFR